MVTLGVCCANLKDEKALMKMGLGLVLVGHVNFLLGALVHGAVLRNINVHAEARAMEYAISNVIALVSGLMAIIAGVIAIVLSKNKTNKILRWFLLVVSLLAALLAAASAVGLVVSIVMGALNGGKSLLTHCELAEDVDLSVITDECPFDPTRVYGTTLCLWMPLILMSVVEVVFSGRCFMACVSFLHLWSCRKRKVVINTKRVQIQRPSEMRSLPRSELQESEPAEQHELLNQNSTSM